MTIGELNKICKSPIKVLSAYDGHIMCKYFNPKKHIEISKKEILDLWADVDVSRNGFTPYINQIVSVYVHDDEEYIKKKEAKKT